MHIAGIINSGMQAKSIMITELSLECELKYELMYVLTLARVCVGGDGGQIPPPPTKKMKKLARAL